MRCYCIEQQAAANHVQTAVLLHGLTLLPLLLCLLYPCASRYGLSEQQQQEAEAALEELAAARAAPFAAAAAAEPLPPDINILGEQRAWVQTHDSNNAIRFSPISPLCMC